MDVRFELTISSSSPADDAIYEGISSPSGYVLVKGQPIAY